MLEQKGPVRSGKVRRVIVQPKRRKLEETPATDQEMKSSAPTIDVNKIPVSSENFLDIINKKMVYVDKTDVIHDMLEFSSSIFIARPRKFGKSLILEIMLHILEGSKHLFEGLKICTNREREWTKHAVFRFNFAQNAGDVVVHLILGIEDVCNKYGITVEQMNESFKLKTVLLEFNRVVNTLTNQGCKIAVLVDEYDIPIVKYIEKDHTEEELLQIKNNSELLSQFFNEVKNNRNVSKFIVTGVAKFTKTLHFSAANHLKDVSSLPLTSTLYGYTREDLKTYFSDYLEALACKKGQSVSKLIDDIVEYYNGYCFSFSSDATVLNPFDINELLKEQSTQFKPYWIRHGRPTYIGEKPWAECVDIASWKDTSISETNFDRFEPVSISSNTFIPGPFLVQLGLLTICKKGNGYYLDFPNMEVKSTFIEALVEKNKEHLMLEHARVCQEYIRSNDSDGFADQLKSFFTCLPYAHTWRIVKFEAYYHTCLYKANVSYGV
ncbi:predicted protein [Naegleria gruberi]|uniref:Predicted protein n=1 Tax=Naegleria gruberi TaxID=5762 RepID=D2V8B4_NAEGR|nr:uncharacterized protein NAEGRDRAFT_65093 [Naegleria gruberi]EFC47150.1 predicted protein [Naegleria gruberi]|eukprot:XP_002679894.1 predicted protein [Naegleria gruberi strain NEG-M]